jgi:ribonuclease III
MASGSLASSHAPDPESTPYNPKNYLITEEDLTLLLSENGMTHPFNNLNLYRMAFVHKSYCTRRNENFVNGNANCPDGCLGLQESSNERLEFLGDSVLNLIVAHYLYERFPDSEEGFLTKIRTRLVNGQMLAVLSEKIGLDRYVLISKQIEDNHGRKNLKILEDTFEAFLGALFLDFEVDGFGRATDFIVHILETNIDFSELITTNHNYKDMLLKYFQHSMNYLPRFYELSVDTRNNNKVYTICVKNMEGMVIATGTGSNKKQAENQAARNGLVYYGQL